MRDKPTFGGFLVVLAIIGILALAIWSHTHTVRSDHEKVHQWAAQNGYTVIEVHSPGVFESQPFWLVDEDDRIYLATLRDHFEKDRVSGFKFNFWGMTQKWKN